MKKVLLIVNPISGKMKAKASLVDVISVIQSKGMLVTVVLTEYRGHAKELSQSASKQGYDIIICFGGDGTLNETISGIMQSGKKLPLGYIPAGSTNDFAKSMMLSSNPAKAALAVAKGNEIKIDIGSFGDTAYFTYVAAFGIFTATSYNVSQGLKNVLGHFAYVLGGVKEIANMRSYRVKVILDNQTEIEDDFVFWAIANSTSIAGIVKLNENDVDKSDGIFEVGLIKKPKNIIELNKTITAVSTSNFNNGGVELYHAKTIQIISNEELDWTLDGEYAKGGKDIIIKNNKQAISFIK